MYSTRAGSFNVLGPDIALAAQDVPGLLFRQFRRDRLEGVDLLQRDVAADGLWPALAVLVIIKVAVAGGAHDHVVAAAGGLDPALRPAPGHDRGPGRQAALQDLVPADQTLAPRRQKVLDPPDEPALQLLLVLQPFLPDPRLAAGAGLPAVLGALVAADVEPGAGEEVGHLGEHVLQERDGGVVAGAVDVLEDAPGAPAPATARRCRTAPGRPRGRPGRGRASRSRAPRSRTAPPHRPRLPAPRPGCRTRRTGCRRPRSARRRPPSAWGTA